MATSPGKKVDVPTVSFRVITDAKAFVGPAGVQSEQARSYGYNDFSYFERPEHYIRHIEPIESELAVQVEYDMDEQDQEWLDAVNAERKKEQMGPVSYELFEVIIDKLEKEWFNLIKRIPQPQSHLPVEDSKCAICDDGEGENSNAIVFCDGCNLAVHQDCYGVPYIPEGQWLCRKCTVSPENPVSCLFCPNEGGAFKQTTTGLWSHLLCAIWIPELGVGNSIYMEPVESVENVPKSRWKLVCSLCKERVGACIQCEKPSCFTAFHVTCARQAGLLMSMKLMGADGQLKAFCDKHLPADWRLASEADDIDDESYHGSEEDSEDAPSPASPRKRKRNDSTTTRPTTITTKSARAHAKSYRPGPPIVPRMIVNRLVDYVAKVSINKRNLFIERLCRYWSLKREARRGAPLLKRLHLEPWTATTESRDETEAEKVKKLEFLVALRNDLEKVRLLAELVRKREKEKLRQAQVIKDVVESFVFQHFTALRAAYERIAALDKEDIFLHPVDKDEVPDYYEVIKEPICFSDIDEKIDNVIYRNVAEFKHDISLVFANAQVYNKSDTAFYRRAGRYKSLAEPILSELDGLHATSSLLPAGDEWIHPADGAVGDLETSLARLHTLLAPDRTDPTRDLLASIFVSEVEKPKEPTPPRPKRQYVDRKKLQAEREERYQERKALGGLRTSRRNNALASSPLETPAPELAAEPEPVPEPQHRSEPGPSGTSFTPRRRTRRAVAEAEASSASSSPGSIKPMKHPQRGVLGVRSVPVLTDAQRRAKEKRLDLVTTSLDARHQNERFNVGWILPEGSKRRRAEPDPPKLKEPPKSKPRGKVYEPDPKEKNETEKEKTGKENGRPRNVSLSSARSTTPRSSKRNASPLPLPGPSAKRLKAESDDDELTPVPDSAPLTATEPTFPDRGSLSPLPEDMATPRKKMDVSEEETEGMADEQSDDKEESSTRKEAMEVEERNENVQAEAAELVENDKGMNPPGPPEEGNESAPPEAGNERAEDGTLESATAVQEEDHDGSGQMAMAASEEDKVPNDDSAAEPAVDDAPTTGPSAAVPPQASIAHSGPSSPPASKVKLDFRPGMQVWAKVTSFPYFPAQIVDPVTERETVPQSVLDLEESSAKNGAVLLVRFYDKEGSWGWATEDRIAPIGGEDDVLYLAGKEPGKKKKAANNRTKAKCRKAYNEAVAAMKQA
ncbi:hypothetical protein CcaverHIS002_0505710 [Cutaneotrichosporon cavernicola]|uniref:Uncharacterized protein n=1 Tax=Cutaneotrichosporon cavernicola TaxID=279322 RepID=A0AA48L6U2_9TREE|nr:uncharacterized protein CcaverHIS019_0506240 [Cutaneotrichosporon cavernicola]BEI85170.1 hypothetical protein CcaverHIS002_0505710 [Cutaneotrichosporon cavernicola]BEI92996.1 hypothetical protein CcaverHIS019_0506240 [Cutaneotrichosporon cavernicola]BEJ00772.1 hypothetical protein CcaverHIS631_0506290 [Cutaneotrichosporon cavernicola]BEJ08537.1 hypothetical protein CcaverHIS641_0506310 [Cutaneotrichosporon cavernicola]